MTLREALRSGTAYLDECGIRESQNDAWLLLEYVTGLNRTRFLLEGSCRMEEDALEQYQILLKNRGKHIPLQQLTGEQDFMGLTFAVNGHVLIPRQDTEIMVEEVLKVLQPGDRVLDLCTGSGCIAVSVKLLGPEGVQVEASDISEEALKVARKNAGQLGAEVRFMQGDLFEPVSGIFECIISNPPYIETQVIGELDEEVRIHEPWQALDGGKDGLVFYRRIIPESLDHLVRGGKLFLEIGCDQGQLVTELLKENGYGQVRLIRDLAGLDRVAVGEKLPE